MAFSQHLHVISSRVAVVAVSPACAGLRCPRPCPPGAPTNLLQFRRLSLLESSAYLLLLLENWALERVQLGKLTTSQPHSAPYPSTQSWGPSRDAQVQVWAPETAGPRQSVAALLPVVECTSELTPKLPHHFLGQEKTETGRCSGVMTRGIFTNRALSYS